MAKLSSRGNDEFCEESIRSKGQNEDEELV